MNLIVSEIKGAGEVSEQTTTLNDSTQVVFSDSTQTPSTPSQLNKK